MPWFRHGSKYAANLLMTWSVSRFLVFTCRPIGGFKLNPTSNFRNFRGRILGSKSYSKKKNFRGWILRIFFLGWIEVIVATDSPLFNTKGTQPREDKKRFRNKLKIIRGFGGLPPRKFLIVLDPIPIETTSLPVNFENYVPPRTSLIIECISISQGF